MPTNQITERHSIDETSEIGDVIYSRSATLDPGVVVRLNFTDKWGRMKGSVLLARPDEELIYSATGYIYHSGSERMVEFSLDFAEGEPVRIGPSAEAPETHSIGEYYGEGLSWSKENAPGIKMYQATKEASQLKKRAAEAMREWGGLK